MRAILLSFGCCLWLSGCAYYGDIHGGNTKPFDTASLSIPHTYKKSTQRAVENHWWHKFKDPQLNLLVDTALSDSPTLQSAQARVKQTQYLSAEVESALWPSVDFSGYVQRQRFSFYGLEPPPFNGKIFNIGDLGLNFNYEFDFWGKNREALKARISSEIATEAELAETQLILAASIANTYFQLCNDHEQVKVAQENWQIGKQILQIATHRTQQGVESDIPVKTIEANVKATEQTLEEYRQAEGLARHQLAVLLGKNPFVTNIILERSTFQKQQIQIPSHLPASLLAQRPDILAAKARAEAAAHEIKVAKARFFPNINLSALYSYQGVGLEHLFLAESQNNAITGAIDLPIFDAGARRANLGAKYAEYDSAVNEYNASILTALREVADQLSILQTVNSRLKAQKSALMATTHNYKLYSLRYTQGITDYASVLENKQLVLQQQAVQIALQTQHEQAVVAMLKALGGHDSIGQG